MAISFSVLSSIKLSSTKLSANKLSAAAQEPSPQPVLSPAHSPLYLETVSAGFPSPAQDYVEQRLDLNQLCVKRPAATYFVRVEGDSMIEAGILPDDLLVVDRSLQAVHGDTVIASLNGEFTVKQLATTPQWQLIPRNSRYRPIPISADDAFELCGVVTGVIRTVRRG